MHSKKKTSGQSNLTIGRMAAAHGRFSGIRHVAPVCTAPNTCFLEPIRVQIPNDISIGSAVFAQLTAESRYTLQRAAPLLLKIAPSHGGSEPHLIRGSLGQPKFSNQTASRLVEPLLQGSLF